MKKIKSKLDENNSLITSENNFTEEYIIILPEHQTATPSYDNEGDPLSSQIKWFWFLAYSVDIYQAEFA